jgi:hypothetical protein
MKVGLIDPLHWPFTDHSLEAGSDPRQATVYTEHVQEVVAAEQRGFDVLAALQAERGG